MRIRNCPYCHLNGKLVLAATGKLKCPFCHGRKKVTSAFVTWSDKRDEFIGDLRMALKTSLEWKLERELDEETKQWDKKYPKPRKFPPKV